VYGPAPQDPVQLEDAAQLEGWWDDFVDWMQGRPRRPLSGARAPRRRVLPLYGGASLTPEMAALLEAYPYLGAHQELGDLGISFKKIRRKVKRAFKKVERKVLRPLVKTTGAVVGGLTAGTLGIKAPKELRLTGKYSKLYRRAGKVGRVAAIAGGAVFAGPAIAGLVAKGAPLAMGGLKFLGGKLVQAPRQVLDALRGKGLDPVSASVQDVLEAATETGAVSTAHIEAAARQAREAMPPDYGQYESPTRPLGAGDEYEGPPVGVQQAGMATPSLGGLGPLPLAVGGGLVLYALSQSGGARRRR
jgi:hypothetical protein